LTHSDIRFADPETQLCPFPAYDALRAEQPVYLDPKTGNYVLTAYGSVRKALLNHKALRNRTGLVQSRTGGVQSEVERLYRESGWLPIDTLVSNELTASFVPGEEFDFLDAFAVRLPMFVIAEQLGIARADMDRFKVWSDISVESTSPTLAPERELEITRLLIEMQQYLAEVIRRVEKQPDETLISRLCHAETEGGRLDMREMLGVLHQILIAGNETTTTTLASAMKILIEQPALVESLQQDPSLIANFVEEVLRAHSPVQTMFRKAAEPVEIEGVAIPQGAIIEVRYGAANRDSQVYDCPEKIDLHRANASSHLAFGAGIHLCIGNQLARGELRMAFATLIDRFSGFRATRGERSFEWMTSYIAHGPLRLWMALDKRNP
jgi:cytochrome P450